MANVFLDHQSTTPVAPEVVEAMRPFFTESFGSPSSLHHYGLTARDALAVARERLAALLGADSPEEIIFTSGGTEAANLAVKGTAYANRKRGKHIVCTAIEHPAVLNSVGFLEEEGFTVTRLAVDARGWVDPEAVRAALRHDTILVCVHHVNHDIGTIEPIGAVSAVTNEAGVPLFVDATASAGWLPLDVQAWGTAMVSLAPHRFYGPKGVGVLYRHRRARITEIIHGGVQEGGRRAGMENVPAIVGAGVAAELAARELAPRMDAIADLQRHLWTGLRSKIPYLHLNGPEPGPERLATNLNLSSEFTEGEGQALLSDMRGIAMASGTSCVSKALQVSHVLTALGLPHALAQASVIMSLGAQNTRQEIDYVIETFPQVIERLRSLSPTWDDFQAGRAKSVLETWRAGLSGRS